jgi:hypothetical protein
MKVSGGDMYLTLGAYCYSNTTIRRLTAVDHGRRQPPVTGLSVHHPTLHLESDKMAGVGTGGRCRNIATPFTNW